MRTVCLFRRMWVMCFWMAVAAVMAVCVVSARAQDSPSTDAPPEPDKNVPVVREPAPVERPQMQAPAVDQVAPEGGVPGCLREQDSGGSDGVSEWAGGSEFE